MKKKALSLITAAVLAATALAGCSTSSAPASGDAAAATESAQDTAAAGTTAAADDSAVGEDKELQKITVAASPTPHAEILAAAKPLLAEQGYDLEVTEFQDYVQPNKVVDSGEIDANYFQHIPYLDSFNEEQGTDLVVAGKIHYELFGIYPGTKTSLNDIADGDTIAVPNDTTNEARALLLLQENNIIKLKDGAGLEATVNDIDWDNSSYKVNIEELEAAQISHVIGEVSYAILNGNYALQSGLSAEHDALVYESGESDAVQTYVNVIAVKNGRENDPGIQALVNVLKSDEIKKFINEKYNGAVLPAVEE